MLNAGSNIPAMTPPANIYAGYPQSPGEPQ